MIVMSGVLGGPLFHAPMTPRPWCGRSCKPEYSQKPRWNSWRKVPTPQFIWAVNKAVKAREAQGDRISWAPQPSSYYTCDPLEGDFSAASLKVPTMVGSVFSEVQLLQSGPDYSACPPRSEGTGESPLWRRGRGRKSWQLSRKAFPGMNEGLTPCTTTRLSCPPTVEYVEKKAGGQRAGVQLPVQPGVRRGRRQGCWHCSDIPYFFHNGEMVPVCH